MSRSEKNTKRSRGKRNSGKDTKERKARRDPYARWTVLALACFCLYLAGWIYPDLFWGVHYVAFLPLEISIVFMAVALVLTLPPVSRSLAANFNQWFDKIQKKQIFFPLAALVSVCSFGIFMMFPIETDIYGDYRIFLENCFNNIGAFDSKWLVEIFSPAFLNPDNGERFTIPIIKIMANSFGTSPQLAFRIFDAAAGMGFIILWLIFVRFYLNDNSKRLIAFLLGAGAGSMQLFFGHVEVYTFPLLCNTAFLICTVSYFVKPRRMFLILQFILLLACIKSHTSGFMMVPIFLLSIFFAYLHNKKEYKGTIRWKYIFLLVLLPSFIIFLIYYFTTGNYSGSLVIAPERLHTDIFLPLLAGEAPLDSYALLSWNHLFDWINMLFLFGAGALFVVMGILLFHRKKIDFNRPEVILSGLAFILYIALFFAFNPRLSMQRDWDLCTLPAPAMILFAIVLLKQTVHVRIFSNRVVGPVLALSIFTVAGIVVNSEKDMVSGRLVSLGVRSYRTYFHGSSYIINVALSKYRDKPEEYKAKYREIYKKLRPDALEGRDKEYAYMLIKLGAYLYNRKDYTSALKYFREATRYFENQDITEYLAATYNKMGDIENTIYYSSLLIRMNPEDIDHFYMVVDACYRAGKIDQALRYCKYGLKKHPGNKNLLKVRNYLLATLE